MSWAETVLQFNRGTAGLCHWGNKLSLYASLDPKFPSTEHSIWGCFISSHPWENWLWQFPTPHPGLDTPGVICPGLLYNSEKHQHTNVIPSSHINTHITFKLAWNIATLLLELLWTGVELSGKWLDELIGWSVMANRLIWEPEICLLQRRCYFISHWLPIKAPERQCICNIDTFKGDNILRCPKCCLYIS